MPFYLERDKRRSISRKLRCTCCSHRYSPSNSLRRADKHTAFSSFWATQKRPSRHYVPITASVPWLCGVLLVILACIGLLEAALRHGIKASSDDHVDVRLARRQEPAVTSTATSSSSTIISSSSTGTAVSTIPATTLAQTTTTTDDPSSITTRTSQDGDTSTLSDASLATLSSASEAYILPTTTSVPSRTTSVGRSRTPTSLPATSGVSHSPTIVQSIASESYILPTSTSSDTRDSLSTTSTTSTTSVEPTIYFSTASNAYITAVTSTTADGVYVTTAVATSVDAYITPTTTTTDSPPVTSPPGSQPPGTVDSTYTTSSTVVYTTIQTDADGSLTTLTTSTTTLFVTSPTTSAEPGKVAADEIQLTVPATDFKYFGANYLAVLIAVLLKLLWSVVFSSMKMMEPFYQLSKPGGASVQNSLLSEYLSTGYSLKHLRSIFHGHWVMLTNTIIYVCITVLSPLASESMGIIATAYCVKDGLPHPCNAVWVMRVPFARAVEGILCTVAVLILVLMVQCWRRSSRLVSNPSSIASVAALMGQDDFLDDLRRLDPAATDEQAAEGLGENRYLLADYKDLQGRRRYGIISAAKSETSIHTRSVSHNLYSALDNTAIESLGMDLVVNRASKSLHRQRTVRDACFVLFTLGLFGVILAYYLDGSDEGFNRFFNSATFGPRLILVCAALVVSFHWKTLEREVRIMAPYRRLAHRLADPTHTILNGQNGTPWSSVPLALYRNEIFHAFIAGVACLSDILIITVAGVPFNRGQLFVEFLVVTYVSIGILCLMLLGLLGVFWWRAGNKRLNLPREPDTLLGVCLMLCNDGNSLRHEFAGTETEPRTIRNRACRERQGKYWGGWVKDYKAPGGEGWRWCIEGEKEGQVVDYFGDPSKFWTLE